MKTVRARSCLSSSLKVLETVPESVRSSASTASSPTLVVCSSDSDVLPPGS